MRCSGSYREGLKTLEMHISMCYKEFWLLGDRKTFNREVGL
jgi:hypothetical protein